MNEDQNYRHRERAEIADNHKTPDAYNISSIKHSGKSEKGESSFRRDGHEVVVFCGRPQGSDQKGWGRGSTGRGGRTTLRGGTAEGRCTSGHLQAFAPNESPVDL